MSMDIMARGLATRAIRHRGALVTKAADQTGANYTSTTAIAWDSEAYDTDGIHDNVTNNTRLTVPPGVSKVLLRGGVRLANAASIGLVGLYLFKNGSVTYPGSPGFSVASSGGTQPTPALGIDSPVLPVIPGDYFELELQVNTDTSIDVTAQRSWFEMLIVE